ncbi:MAG: hypothetical protein RL616_2354 [Verrucomicrobiota bacterium]
MKTLRQFRLFCFLTFTTALAVFSSGCATHEEHSFNDDFGQSLPTAPKYFIENINDDHFTITTRQGQAMKSEERIIFVKRATSAVAETEAKRRGWENWQLEYIRQGDTGWMFVAKADVVRKNAVQFKGDAPSKNP